MKINKLNDAELMQFLQNQRRLGQSKHWSHSVALHQFALIEVKRRKLV